jgi:hypothetical protein
MVKEARSVQSCLQTCLQLQAQLLDLLMGTLLGKQHHACIAGRHGALGQCHQPACVGTGELAVQVVGDPSTSAASCGLLLLLGAHAKMLVVSAASFMVCDSLVPARSSAAAAPPVGKVGVQQVLVW